MQTQYQKVGDLVWKSFLMTDTDRANHLERLQADRDTWVCYECRDDNCCQCVGVPCDCPCEPTEPEYSIWLGIDWSPPTECLAGLL